MRGVLVTGGTKRIGRAICEYLATRGYTPIVHSRTESDELRAVAESLKGYAVAGDLSSAASAEKLYAQVKLLPVELYAVVNNAAVFSPRKELSPSEKENIFNVNFSSPRLLLELFAEDLRRAGVNGAVVHILDTRVLDGGFEKTPYAESKRMLFTTIRDDAEKFAPYLRVNGIAPGPVLPPVDGKDSEKGGEILLGRRPSPADVAAAAGFLIGTESVTGQVIAVDSGQHLISGRITRG